MGLILESLFAFAGIYIYENSLIDSNNEIIHFQVNRVH